MIKTLNLNVSGIKRDVALKQRPDRFSSIGEQIQVTSTFEHTWTTQDILLQEFLRNLRSSMDF